MQGRTKKDGRDTLNKRAQRRVAAIAEALLGERDPWNEMWAVSDYTVIVTADDASVKATLPWLIEWSKDRSKEGRMAMTRASTRVRVQIWVPGCPTKWLLPKEAVAVATAITAVAPAEPDFSGEGGQA